ncbi:MAG: antitoxin VbhA family protein [Lachnospiraceae bacterium]|nr:antitoxin VbhA family protein [Lachnospiraceae bacterium]
MKDKIAKQINDIREDPFEEYTKLGEPDKADMAYAWQTAVGLQDVDNLRPSEYLLNTAKENIEGNISIDEVRKRIDSYYEELGHHVSEGTEEGEKNVLKNRYMHIRWDETTHSTGKQDVKQRIEGENSILTILDTKKVSLKMKENILKLHEAFGMEKVFGRADVVEVLGITERPASTLLGKMYSLELTEKITGVGKGRYRFVV